MQLPQELQHFPHPTLIVVGDHVHAQFWLAHNENAELLNEIEMRPELKSDNEGSFVNTDNGAVNGNEPNDKERLKHFIKAVAEQIVKIVHGGQAQAFHLVMIKELGETVMSDLHDDVRAKASWPIEADLRYMPVVEAIGRVVKKY